MWMPWTEIPTRPKSKFGYMYTWLGRLINPTNQPFNSNWQDGKLVFTKEKCKLVPTITRQSASITIMLSVLVNLERYKNQTQTCWSQPQPHAPRLLLVTEKAAVIRSHESYWIDQGNMHMYYEPKTRSFLRTNRSQFIPSSKYRAS